MRMFADGQFQKQIGHDRRHNHHEALQAAANSEHTRETTLHFFWGEFRGTLCVVLSRCTRFDEGLSWAFPHFMPPRVVFVLFGFSAHSEHQATLCPPVCEFSRHSTVHSDRNCASAPVVSFACYFTGRLCGARPVYIAGTELLRVLDSPNSTVTLLVNSN